MLRSFAVRSIAIGYRAGRATPRGVAARAALAIVSAAPHLVTQLVRRGPAA